MKIRQISPALALAIVWISVNGTAQTSPAPAPKSNVIALIAAVGDQFTYVRQKESTGSNVIDNNVRRVVKAPGDGLNMAILRGMDSAIAATDPTSERLFLSLNAAEMEGVRAQDREEIAIGKIVAALEKNPDRARWDRVIVITPKYLFSERAGMGPKLQGLGMYVQPLVGGKLGEFADGLGVDLATQGESDTTTPSGGLTSAKTYVAPFAYLQKYELDPKTLRVISKEARHDYQKLSDPNSTALDVERSIDPVFLATRINRLAERSAARALGASESDTRIEIGDIKPVQPEPAKK